MAYSSVSSMETLCLFLLMLRSFTEVGFTSPKVNHFQTNHSRASSAPPGFSPLPPAWNELTRVMGQDHGGPADTGGTPLLRTFSNCVTARVTSWPRLGQLSLHLTDGPVISLKKQEQGPHAHGVVEHSRTLTLRKQQGPSPETAASPTGGAPLVEQPPALCLRPDCHRSSLCTLLFRSVSFCL